MRQCERQLDSLTRVPRGFTIPLMAEKDQKGWFERKWHDPVWSKVISAMILAFLGAIWVTLSHGWPAIGAWLSTGPSTWKWVKVGSIVPGWAQILLYLGSAGFMYLVIILTLVTKGAAKNWVKPELKFMGLVWRWQIRKRADRDEMVNVFAFCPDCEMQIHPTRFRDVPRNHTKFICDRCPGHPVRLDFEGEPEDLADLVTREVQRQMRLDILGKTETQPHISISQPGETQETLFEGLRWQWRFQGDQLINIETLCPICFGALPPFQGNPHCPTLYRCRSCRAEIKTFLGTHDELQARFVRCIQHRAHEG
jgi:hypothetical protein